MGERLLKWVIYAIIFQVLVTPGFGYTIKTCVVCAILGFFAGILNDILTELKKK
jgi:hypothetical protein